MQSKRPCQIDTAGRGSGPEDVANEVSYVVPIPLRLRRHSDSISTDGNMPRKAIQIEEPIEGHARLRESALGLRVFLRVTGPLFRRGHYSERTPFEEDSWLISQPRVSVWSGPPAVLWIRLRGKPASADIRSSRICAGEGMKPTRPRILPKAFIAGCSKNNSLRHFQEERRRFRSLLLGSLKHFLASIFTPFPEMLVE